LEQITRHRLNVVENEPIVEKIEEYFLISSFLSFQSISNQFFYSSFSFYPLSFQLNLSENIEKLDADK